MQVRFRPNSTTRYVFTLAICAALLGFPSHACRSQNLLQLSGGVIGAEQELQSSYDELQDASTAATALLGGHRPAKIENDNGLVWLSSTGLQQASLRRSRWLLILISLNTQLAWMRSPVVTHMTQP